MKIEKEKIRLQDLQLSPSSDGGVLTVLNNRKSYRLSKLQYSYMDILKNSGTIEEVVHFFLGQGWLVSFRELHHLLQFLVQEGIVLNPSFRDYFFRPAPQEVTIKSTPLQAQPVNRNEITINEMPFFRSLDPKLAGYLLQKTDKFQVPAQTALTKAGQKDRDLYFLIKGQAAIYRVLGNNRRQMISILNPGSIFGEVGFLLNQPRTADVITLEPCDVLKIHHLPEFDQYIQSEKAKNLQHRFWVLQALQSSTFFKDLPADSLDSLIFSGRLCQLPANQILFHEGQTGNTCYILIQGNVVISQNGKNINTQGQGTCFGEISLLVSQGRRTATVLSQQDCVFLEIDQNNFYRVLAQNLILAKEIETLAADRIANDFKRTNN